MQRLLSVLVMSVLLVGAVLIGGGRPQQVLAQGGVLEYGDVVTGEITVTEPEQSYTFLGNADEVVVVFLEPEDFNSELEPRVTINGPDGETLVMAESFFTVQAAVQLPEDGKYTLTVSRYDGENGESTGRYRLEFLLPEVLGVGDSVSDTISSEDTHYYVVLGLSTFRLTYTRHSGTFGPEVAINLLESSDELFSFGAFQSVASIGGSSTSEGMLRVEHDSDAYVITLGAGFLDFNFGATPASYTIEVSE